MNENVATGLQDSGTNTQLSQVLSHLRVEPPADGDPMCQACGESIVEGDPITLYLSRLTGQSGYTVDQCRCSDHNEDLNSLFTLGVRELVVDGRVGQCRDNATQQTWPALLNPSVRLISARDTTSVRVVSEHEQTPPNNHRQGQTTDCNPNEPDAHGGHHPSLSLLNQGDSVDPAPAKSAGGRTDG